jgi:hypothetical protein
MFCGSVAEMKLQNFFQASVVLSLVRFGFEDIMSPGARVVIHIIYLPVSTQAFWTYGLSRHRGYAVTH